MLNNITKESEYAAFISYRHVAQDRQWAEWLIQALETYRVPRHLQNLGYPERIGKVFRDEDELPLSSDLTDQIKQALAVSRNLIVICSPDTPQSKWIEREIELFKEMGKAERIHAFLIAGEPRTSFPDSLTHHQKTITKEDGTVTTIIEEREPLAANVIPITGIRKKERDKSALLKLIAAIIGCSYDDLVQRDQMREKKKQNILRTVLVSFVLLICSGGLYWWDYNRLKIDYYEQMITRWAAPQGLFPVSEQQARKRNQTYRFESRRNRVERVVMQNGLGFPRNDKSIFAGEIYGGAQRLYSYDESGKIRQVDVLDQTNKTLWQEEYSQDLKSISFKKDNRDLAQSSSHGFFEENINRSKSEITRHEVEYLDGYIIRRRFTNSYGSPKGTVWDNYGVAYERDKNGLISSTTYLDQTNMPKPYPTKYEIDPESGRVQAVSFYYFWLFGEGDYVRQFFIYDQYGNIIKQGFDENSATAYFYDKDGNITEQISKDSKKTFLYDERGNITAEAYFKIDGKPMLGEGGYARMTSTHDWNGNKTEETYFGVDGKLLLNWQGYARVTRVFDERGNNIEEAFFGVDGNPALIEQSYAKLTRIYDERGNEIEEAYFGIDGKPVLSKHDYAKVTRIFDERGNKIEEAYFGVSGSPILIEDGYAKLIFAYDGKGKMIERAYFGIDGKFVLGWSGCAKQTHVYDNLGRSENVCLGIDGKPVMNKDGYAKSIRVDYGSEGYEITYFDMDGKPVLIKDGYARMTRIKNQYGEEENLYYDKNGKEVTPINR
ncbi:MAG: toll/interleukin-1 receptor domain-containing protein [Nitrosomonas sp.]|nr:toll/interleukin-1 receptor domain-containing protein [Nitrosomonas sp.]